MITPPYQGSSFLDLHDAPRVSLSSVKDPSMPSNPAKAWCRLQSGDRGEANLPTGQDGNVLREWGSDRASRNAEVLGDFLANAAGPDSTRNTVPFPTTDIPAAGSRAIGDGPGRDGRFQRTSNACFSSGLMSRGGGGSPGGNDPPLDRVTGGLDRCSPVPRRAVAPRARVSPSTTAHRSTHRE